MTRTTSTRRAAFRSSPYFLLVLTTLMWAGNWVLGRAMRHEIPPVALGFWRWALAAALLLPVTLPELWEKRAIVKRHLFVLASLGALGACAFNTMCYIALQYTAATNGVLFNSMIPALIILLSWLVFRERLTGRQVAGVLLSFTGVAAILARGDPAVLAGLRFNRGDLLLMAAMFLWALYTIVLRWRPPELSASALLAAMLLVSLPLLLPFYLWELDVRGGFAVTPRTVGTLLYYATLPSIIAYRLWNRGVAEVGANRAGLFVHLMPVWGATLSWIFLGEGLYDYHFAGAALIFGGIWLTTRVQRAS